MKTIKGMDGLLDLYKEQPELWFFLYTNVETANDKNELREATFYLPENDDEDEETDEAINKYRPWLEYQTFLGIIDNKLDHHPNATKENLLDAVVYYLENDDFLD